MMLTLLALMALLFAGLPAYFFSLNVFRFRTLPLGQTSALTLPPVSVLIPARNEQDSIGQCVRAVLANVGVDLEVIVLDDHSEDQTATIVSELAAGDKRVQIAASAPLPAGWCGKQHACHQLSQLARFDMFVFLDADVRLTDNALRRMLQTFQDSSVDLLSGFPRQITLTVAEQMLIPLIHFVLLGFLSLRRMRKSPKPAFSAGCGQLMLTHRGAYVQAGGHAAIRDSLHDGLKLPRAYRKQHLKTDLFDATDLATCRMYHNAQEVWQGLQKNATEGIASPTLIVPVTAMLLCGQILPFFLVIYTTWAGLTGSPAFWVSVVAVCLAWIPRYVAAIRYRQSLLGAILHPLSIGCFLLIQWTAFGRALVNRKVAWKGRPYPA